MLNVSAVPILTITLRNNFMQVVPVKRWIRNWNCCTFLLEVSIFVLLLIHFFLYVGSQEERKGNLVDNIYTARNRHCHGRSKPSSHDCVHGRHLWSFHPIFDPDYARVVRSVKAR